MVEPPCPAVRRKYVSSYKIFHGISITELMYGCVVSPIVSFRLHFPYGLVILDE